MGVGDPVDDDRNEFLQHLIDMRCLEQPALGITKLVIDKGEEALSEKQKFVFRRDVLDVFVTEDCSQCGSNVPWSEMYDAYENGGTCGYCLYREEKILNGIERGESDPTG